MCNAYCPHSGSQHFKKTKFPDCSLIEVSKFGDNYYVNLTLCFQILAVFNTLIVVARFAPDREDPNYLFCGLV